MPPRTTNKRARAVDDDAAPVANTKRARTAAPKKAAPKKPAPAKAAPKKAAPKKPATKKAASEPSAQFHNEIPAQVLDVHVFGTGGSGELGMGPKAEKGYFRDPTMIQKPRLNKNLSGKDAKTGDIVQVSVGGIHCAALTKKGAIVTWGANDSSNLARNTHWVPEEKDDESDDDDDLELNPLESTPDYVAAKSFVDADGTVNTSKFVQVEALDNATFALAEDGRVWGWGQFRGNDGPFGFLKDLVTLLPNGKPEQSTLLSKVPVPIPGLTNITSLAAGANHVLALSSTGAVFAWGAGGQGELGRVFRSLRTNSPYDSLVPQQVPLPKSVKIAKIFAGSHSSFAIDDKGKVWAWGLNNFAQTGVPPTAAERAGSNTVFVGKPTVVKALAEYKIKDIAPGSHHTVACAEDGTVLAWGRCDYAQMGQDLDGMEDVLMDSRGRAKELTKPTVVPGVTASSVAAGIDCCIAAAPDGKVYSWGYADGYRIGHATDEDTIETPTALGRDVDGKKITWAGCGGQFSVVAGPANE